MVDTGWLSANHQKKKRLFYFTRSEHALSALKDNRIKVSEFSKCNDVFELYHFSGSDAKLRRDHRDWAKGIEGKVRFVCLSEGWQDPLMWGYYGDNGLGACLVVDVLTENLEKVEYVRSRKSEPTPNSFPRWGEEGFKKFCARKSRLWQREREHRLFLGPEKALDSLLINGQLIRFLPCGKEISIVGVINGPKAEREKLQAEAANRSVNYLQSRAAFTIFKVREQENLNYWKSS